MSFWSCGFGSGDKAYYTSLGWAFNGATTVITSTAGEFHVSSAGNGDTYGLFVEDDASSPTIGIGGRWLHFWMSGDTVNNHSVYFRNGTSINYSVVFHPTGAITLRRGNGGQGIQVTGTYNPEVAHWVAIEANIATVGQVTVFIDNVQVAQRVGNTQRTAAVGWDNFRLDGNNQNVAYGSFVITTAAEGRLTEQFVPALPLDGNDLIGSGALSTGGAGTFANVDEIPVDNGATYNQFSVAATDRYTTSLPWTPVSVHSVTVLCQASKDVTFTQAQTVCATDTLGGGVTEALGAANVLGADDVYVVWQDTFNVDPDTAISWTPVGLGDLRAGIKYT